MFLGVDCVFNEEFRGFLVACGVGLFLISYGAALRMSNSSRKAGNPPVCRCVCVCKNFLAISLLAADEQCLQIVCFPGRSLHYICRS